MRKKRRLHEIGRIHSESFAKWFSEQVNIKKYKVSFTFTKIVSFVIFTCYLLGNK